MRRIIESTMRSSPVLWPSQTGGYCDASNSIRKYVFSSTLTDAAPREDTLHWRHRPQLTAGQRLSHG